MEGNLMGTVIKMRNATGLPIITIGDQHNQAISMALTLPYLYFLSFCNIHRPSYRRTQAL